MVQACGRMHFLKCIGKYRLAFVPSEMPYYKLWKSLFPSDAICVGGGVCRAAGRRGQSLQAYEIWPLINMAPARPPKMVSISSLLSWKAKVLEMYQVQRLFSIKKAAWSSWRAVSVWRGGVGGAWSIFRGLPQHPPCHTLAGSAHNQDSAGLVLNQTSPIQIGTLHPCPWPLKEEGVLCISGTLFHSDRPSKFICPRAPQEYRWHAAVPRPRDTGHTGAPRPAGSGTAGSQVHFQLSWAQLGFRLG